MFSMFFYIKNIEDHILQCMYTTYYKKAVLIDCFYLIVKIDSYIKSFKNMKIGNLMLRKLFYML